MLRVVIWSGLDSVWHLHLQTSFQKTRFACLRRALLLNKFSSLLWLVIPLILFSKWALIFEKVTLQKSHVRFFVCQGRVRQEKKDMHMHQWFPDESPL